MNNEVAIKELCNKLSFTHGKYSEKDIFKDLVELDTYLILSGMLNQEDKAKEFDKVMKKYTTSEQKDMWQLIVELNDLYSKQHEPNDILGEIFNNLNMGNFKTGQYFTPAHISMGIAEIIEIDEKEIKEKGYTSLHEPSCRSRWYGFIFC